MDVSVIIVSYNTKELTLDAIRSIYEHTQHLNYEVIVIDNNSNDGSISAIREHYPEVVLAVLPENIGFGKANNIGINNAKGEFVFLFNSDAVLLSNTIFTFLKYMRLPQNSEVGIVGANLITGHEGETLSYGNFPSLLEAFSALGFFIFYKKYYLEHMSAGVVNKGLDIKTVDYITGADMFIRKTVLEKVGAFDPDFFMYFEDAELSFRVKKAGYESRIIPQETIVHKVSYYRDMNAPVNYNKVKIYESSRKLYYIKCYGNFAALLSNIAFALQKISNALFYKERGWFKKAIISITR